MLLSRTNKTLSAVPPCLHGCDPCAQRDTNISPATDVCPHVAEYFAKSHLTAPSAVHLTARFLPASQHRRLSVKASLTLSPLQRFSMLNFLYCSIAIRFCQVLMRIRLKKSTAISLPGKILLGIAPPFSHILWLDIPKRG